MATETVTTNICDRCGSRHNPAEYTAGNTWGQLSLSWLGDIGGKAYDGAAGGCQLKGKAWICLPCTEAFQAFMRPPTAAIDPREQAFRIALHDYPRLNTHQLQARKVCAGVMTLAESIIDKGR